MMLQYDLDKMPGRWRSGPVYVHDSAKRENVYEGPPAGDVPDLMDEFAESLVEDNDDLPPLIRAAMAHLNLVMIHPFKDGNGRMARAVQTLVLAREGILAPEFCSIEEYLGRNAIAYYDVLANVGRGSYQPENDTRAWIRFTLTAHYRQALRLLRRVTELQRLFDEIERQLQADRLDVRMVSALAYVAFGRRLRRKTYISLADISDAAATRDLKALVDADYIEPHGQKRGRYYTASPRLKGIREQTREHGLRPEDADPFEQVKQGKLLPD